MDKNSRPKIVIIDDNITNLNIARKALCDDYSVVLIKDGAMAIAELPNINPDLILLDVEMPGLSGFDVIRVIKEQMPEPYCSVPVIFLTAKDDGDSEYQGLNLGAVDYVIKPFSSVLLKKRVELHLKLHNYSTRLEHLVDEKAEHFKELQYAIVYTLSEMVERRDGNTGGHIMRTSKYLEVLLAQVLQDGIYRDSLRDVDVRLCAKAAQMHDVGKICISDAILRKPGALSAQEFAYMREHPSLGEDIITSVIKDVQEVEFLEIAKVFAAAHHEKWNGTGYPRGLCGEQIPIFGRLLAIVDAYDAITSERPYKAPKPHHDAVAIIQADSGTHFDPLLVTSFLAVADTFAQIHDSCDSISILGTRSDPFPLSEV